MSVLRIRFAIFFLFAAVTAFFIYTPLVSEAQFNLGGEPTLKFSPSYPRPNSEVEVSLEAYSVDTVGATIHWYIDGIEQQQFKNERSITMSVGDIGTTKTIRATLVPPTGFATAVTETISPSQIDIIVEADTYVPSFYKGRALPSSEAAIRIIAIPHTRLGGQAATYTYKWELDRKVLFGGPLKGKNVIETTMPTYNDGQLIVTVFDANNNVIAKSFKQLNLAEPQILFYEENPLRGLTRRAVGDTFTLLGEEVTVKAEPYFMNREIANGAGMFDWKVNSRTIENPSSRPTALTLRKEGGSGSARVELTARNTNQLLQYASGAFNIFFE